MPGSCRPGSLRRWTTWFHLARYRPQRGTTPDRPSPAAVPVHTAEPGTDATLDQLLQHADSRRLLRTPRH
jgi:hypothetical protein